MKINFNRKGIDIDVRKVSFLGRFRGLMFRNRKTDNLLFEFNKFRRNVIHSLFVFFDFLAVWLDKENNVVGIDVVRPFRFSVRSREGARKLIEVPLNDSNRDIWKLLVGKRKDLYSC